MSTITLDSIRAAAEAKYGSYVIEDLGVTLLNPIRLPRERRDELIALSSDISKDDEEETEEASSEAQEKQLTKIIELVAATPEQANKLIAWVSTEGYIDLGILEVIVSGYMESQKVGEASASQD